MGHPGAGFYEPPVNRFDDRIARQVRQRYGGTVVFPSYLSAATAHRVLTETPDGFLIYVDEVFRGRIAAPALGRPLRIEGNIANVAKLARLTGAAVIPCYCLRLADSARFKLVLLPVVPIVHSDNRKADLLANVTAINAAVEPVIRAHADQWYYALDFEPE
jgi:KDO2-lipid IV(A) lauroyltransferase